MVLRFSVGLESDLDQIMLLFDDARQWHADIGVSQWPQFEISRVTADISSGNLFVLSDELNIVGSVTVTTEDPYIWKDGITALYVHRLVVDRNLKGMGLGGKLVAHVEEMALSQQRQCLRLDCWANNEQLKRYYERIGFVRLNDLFVGDEPSLPLHYRNSTTTLFEKRCSNTGKSLAWLGQRADIH